MKGLCQGDVSLGLIPSEYEAGVPATTPRRSVDKALEDRSCITS